MSNHSRILSRTLTTEYYRANAMFFLAVIALSFGFMRGAEHMALAAYFVSSTWLLMIPVAVWIIYTIKVIKYNNDEIRFVSNSFLYSLPLTDFKTRASAYLTVAIGQLAPAIAYGLFLISIARSLESTMIILTTQLAMIGITSWLIHRSLIYPQKEQTSSRPTRYLDKTFSKGPVWMYTEGTLRASAGQILTIKVITCLVVYGATQLYLYDVYDARLYLMAACVAFSANLVTVYVYQRFEIGPMSFMRSLPVTSSRRITTFILTMIILCFPEIAILATNLPGYIGVQHYLFAIVFGISLLIFGYGALYVRDATFDDFTRWIFFVSMGLVLLILFSVPAWIFAILQTTAGIYLLRKNFYSFELNT
jgi:hypothetical protein